MMKLNNILNFKKQFKIILNYVVMIFSLLVGASLMSGCVVHKTANFENSNSQKWEDYFDSDEFKPVNEDKENLQIKENLKKAI